MKIGGARTYENTWFTIDQIVGEIIPGLTKRKFYAILKAEEIINNYREIINEAFIEKGLLKMESKPYTNGYGKVIGYNSKLYISAPGLEYFRRRFKSNIFKNYGKGQ